jgi:hypothetical protein
MIVQQIRIDSVLKGAIQTGFTCYHNICIMITSKALLSLVRKENEP